MSPVPMAVLIGRDAIVIPNDSAAALVGSDRTRLLGRPMWASPDETLTQCRQAVADCFEGDATQLRGVPTTVRRDGAPQTAWLDVAFTPVMDDAHVVHGALLVVSEAAPPRAAEPAPVRAALDTRRALECGGLVGTWEVDFRTDFVTSDANFARLHGVDPDVAGRGADKQVFIEGIHAEDRAAVLAAFEDVMLRGGDYRLQHRTVGHGQTHWVVSSGRVVLDGDGRPLKFFGVVVDVTEQVKLTLALGESEQMLRALADTVPQIVFSTRADGSADFMNRRWFEHTGLAPQPITEELWQSRVHPDDLLRVVRTWEAAVATNTRYDIEYRSRHHALGYRWVRAMALPLQDDDGKALRWFGTITDVHETHLLARERELLAGELDHRIRNLFVLVDSLIRIAVRAEPEMERFGQLLLERLKALHQAHGLLNVSHPRLRDAVTHSLRDLILMLLKPYAGADNDIAMTGEDLPFNAGVMTSMTLVFHELVVNSAKHGALAAPGGTLQIRFGRDASRLHIDWVERRPPGWPAAPPGSNGFGSRMLELVVERHLRGTLQRHLTADGIEVALAFPADL